MLPTFQQMPPPYDQEVAFYFAVALFREAGRIHELDLRGPARPARLNRLFDVMVAHRKNQTLVAWVDQVLVGAPPEQVLGLGE